MDSPEISVRYCKRVGELPILDVRPGSHIVASGAINYSENLSRLSVLLL